MQPNDATPTSDGASEPTTPRGPARWENYARLLRPHRLSLLGASGLLLLSAALPGSTVVIFQGALDRLLGGASGSEVLVWSAAFVGLSALAAVVQVVRTAWTKSVAWRVTSGLRRQLHARLMLGGVQGGLGARLTTLLQEVDELQYGVSALVTIIRNPLTLIVLGVAAAWLAPWLALWAALLLPMVAIAAWVGARLVESSTRSWRVARSRLAETSQEQLMGQRVVAAYGAHDDEVGRFSRLEGDDRTSRARLDVVRTLPGGLVQFMSALAIGVLLWRGAISVQGGELQPEHLVGFVVALGLAARPLAGLAEVWSLLRRSLVALESVDAALRSAPPVVEADPGRELDDRALTLRLLNVSVKYSEVEVLKVSSLSIQAGSRVALVGPTGAGKSTLLRLAGRLQDPTVGRVFVGGHDLRNISRTSRVGSTGFVEQRAMIFARSVWDNVCLGRDLDDGAVRAALGQAGADFVFERGGLHGVLGELGLDLSGGEAQRICLARALVGRPRVLLLDEATNQVDTTTRDVIAQAIEELAGDCTVLWATHDLELARRADRVLVLRDGEVVEDGGHDALLRLDGLYAELWRAR